MGIERNDTRHAKRQQKTKTSALKKKLINYTIVAVLNAETERLRPFLLETIFSSFFGLRIIWKNVSARGSNGVRIG